MTDEGTGFCVHGARGQLMPTNVAIACQGGGSHTAFTAGVLQTLLPELADSDYRLVGLSGTSGTNSRATSR